MLAPTRGAADCLLHSLGALKGALLGVHRATPIGIASRLATPLMAEAGLAPVGFLGVQALCARSTHHCLDNGTLGYFGPVARTPGFSRALARTLLELRMHRVDRSSLASSAPGRDLVQLLAVFEKELESRGLADRAIVYDLAARAVCEQQAPFQGSPLLLIDVWPGPAAEWGLYQGLVSGSADVLATLMTHDDCGPLERLLGCDAELGDDVAPRSALERVRLTLFEREVLPGESDGSIAFFSTRGEERECVEIARRLRQSAQSGTPFDRMAILLRSPGTYQALIAECLRRAGIPGYFSRGTVRPDQSGRAFLALLECAVEGLSATRFAEYLSLGQLPRTDPVEPGWSAPGPEQEWAVCPPVKPPAQNVPSEETDSTAVLSGNLRAPYRWERLLVDAAVIGGKLRWERRLNGLQQELRVRLRALDEDDYRVGQIERQLEQLSHLTEFALPLIGALEDLPDQASWGTWLSALRALADTSLRRPGRVLGLLAELDPMGDVGPVQLPEVYEVLAGRLRLLQESGPSRCYGHVFVGTLEEARGRSFATVFVPGMCEGSFPAKIAEDPLLLDEHRRALDAELPDLDEQGRRERLLLRIAASAAEQQLVVSYPRVDVMRGRARVPSFYALDVLRSAEGKLPDVRDLEKRAAEAVDAQLGWPAPTDPCQALDQTEYDLATLGPLMGGGSEQIKGRARFLLQANPHLARSLRNRHLRWDPSWSKADGIYNPHEDAREALARRSLTLRSYSPTSLQKFASCPYRFLLYAVLGLRAREEAASIEVMDPLTRGSLYHDVQYFLFGALKQRGWLPVEEANLEQVIVLADELIDQVANRYADELAPAIPQVWFEEVEDLRIDLRTWLRRVAAERTAWQPIHAELAFGLTRHDEQRDPSSRKEPVPILGGYLMRGSIDLVERNAKRGLIRVTDYKTGRCPSDSPEYVGGGEVLQPLVYALVAEQFFDLTIDSGQLTYCTQRGGFKEAIVPLDERGRKALGGVLQTIDRALSGGFLPAAPRKDACLFCDYRMVCGPHEELRVGKKRKGPLEFVQSLRKSP